MAQVRIIKPEKLTAGFIYSREEDYKTALTKMTEEFGRVDTESGVLQFDKTDYYAPEMGTGLKRRFASFEKLLDPGELAQAKLFTNEIEKEFMSGGGRRINIDPGLLSLAKLILASAKNFSHRVYIGRGIWAEVTLQYHDSDFDTLPWTFPEFCQREHKDFFLKVRAIYDRQLKKRT
ncbi:MAG: DUF4416 family protein [Spirochaetia bacterium]|nr:DUF4416 family protein [Spirochaetia bacterium]